MALATFASNVGTGLGVYGLGLGMAQAIAPSTIGLFGPRYGATGLLLPACFFLRVGALCRPLLALALRRAADASRQ